MMDCGENDLLGYLGAVSRLTAICTLPKHEFEGRLLPFIERECTKTICKNVFII